MQRKTFEKDFSFTVVDDNDFEFDESIAVENAKEIPSPPSTNDDEEEFKLGKKGDLSLSGSEDDLEAESPERFVPGPPARLPSASTSNRPRVKSPILRDKPRRQLSESESDESDGGNKKNKASVPGQYNPSLYETLDVNSDVKELFQYITKYIPQQLNLDYKFKPFIPEYLPAVGDIDAFLKVIPPEQNLSGENIDLNQLQLGLAVLDEPAANQSDSALLHLQLRASSVHVSQSAEVVVKTVDNIEKNSKIIDKWIKDITELHRSKTSPIVKYSNPMPDLDSLMQEWPEKVENTLKVQGFPSSKMKCSLSQYIDIICCLFDIPVYENKIQSLHLFFCLYAAIRSSQLYKATNAEDVENMDNERYGFGGATTTTDQLVLE